MCRACHGAGAADGLRRAIEDSQEAVARRLHLSAAKRIQVIAKAGIVEPQEFLPCLVAHSLEHGRGVDDVGEEHRREDPFAGTFGPDPHDPSARPFDRHPRFLTDHPGVVARWDFVDRVGRYVEGVSIVHQDMQDAGHRVAEMVNLTAFGAHDRCEVGRPPPARIEFRPGDGSFIEVDNLGTSLGDWTDLVRSSEAFVPESGHDLVIIGHGLGKD